MLRNVGKELRAHAPLTALGVLVGIALMGVIVYTGLPADVSAALFWTFHPLHVLLSALATAAMYRRHNPGRLWATILVGYAGAVGIATVSDCLIPYAGEWLLSLPNRGAHIGFVEKWWLVNPLAIAGCVLGYVWPRTKLPHASHVFLSTWASLFHMTMALGDQLSPMTMATIVIFLFLAVWLPCCTSDIVFPLLFAQKTTANQQAGSAGSPRSSGEGAVAMKEKGFRP